MSLVRIAEGPFRGAIAKLEERHEDFSIIKVITDAAHFPKGSDSVRIRTYKDY